MEAHVHLKSQLTCALRSYAVSQRADFLVNKGCGGGGTVASLGRSRCCWLGLTEGALALRESEGNWQTRKGGRGCGEENLTIRAVPLRIRQKGLLSLRQEVSISSAVRVKPDASSGASGRASTPLLSLLCKSQSTWSTKPSSMS
jgi:hypothetical protein